MQGIYVSQESSTSQCASNKRIAVLLLPVLLFSLCWRGARTQTMQVAARILCHEKGRISIAARIFWHIYDDTRAGTWYHYACVLLYHTGAAYYFESRTRKAAERMGISLQYIQSFACTPRKQCNAVWCSSYMCATYLLTHMKLSQMSQGKTIIFSMLIICLPAKQVA